MVTAAVPARRDTRSVSYSEISTALTCSARWDMSYGGRLAGDALEPKWIAPILSEGRAWGAGVATWHAHSDQLGGRLDAEQALAWSLTEDYARMVEAGVPADLGDFAVMRDRLVQMLDHYIASTPPLDGLLTRLEGETEVSIPSRRGQRSSNRYRFGCRIDGWVTDNDGRDWLVEFKLRHTLHPVWLIQLQQQVRWYAWAHARATGRTPVGVLVDERWNEVPADPRVLKSGKLSEDKSQRLTVNGYLAACADHEVEPAPELVEHFREIRWGQRVPVMFRAHELADAGRELVAAARLIGELDSGQLSPIRNPSLSNCRRCRYREICAAPGDALFVDTMFRRVPPKRLRLPVAK